jgi:hypothetical protein
MTIGARRLACFAAGLAIAVSSLFSAQPARATDHFDYSAEPRLRDAAKYDELTAEDIAGASPDLIFALRLHLLRGHFAAAKVLASHNRYNEASSHTAQVLRSTLNPIEAELTKRGFASIKGHVRSIHGMSDGHAGELALLREMRTAEMEIWQAYDSISEDERQSVSFNLDLALLLFKQAARQYEAAWQGLRLVHLHEFQNGYGYLLEARWLLARTLPVLRKRNVKAATNIENAYLRLREAWPSIDPPTKPVLPYSTINGLVAAIEINANKLE